MESTKRERQKAEEEPETKKAKFFAVSDYNDRTPTNERVALNKADCDLDFDIEENGLQGYALHDQGFAYCWSGARANVGIRGGKYCFACKVIAAQDVEMEDTPPDQQHLCRVGISRGDNAVGNLGETEHSFGYGGTGKFSNAGKFMEYGEKFEVGDTIVCAVNLESSPLASVGFFKNGKWLGIAKEFNARNLGIVDAPVKEMQWASALFPHVLLKNVVVQVQFSINDGLVVEEGFKPWACAFEDGNAISGPTFSNYKDCEVMMMVGLPASGKTTWAEKWEKEHPEKRYILLGTNMALDQMKVSGLLRKHNYGERFDRLMDRATGIFNALLARAAKTPRNFIIDQTNVYKSARKRKLKPFPLFRKVAIVIFPKPDDLKLRAEKRVKEMGKEVPEEAVNEMLANFILPTSKDMPGSDELFDLVMFPELNRIEALKHLEEMKLALRSASYSELKTAVSPYSRGSSIQSFLGNPPSYPRAVPDTGGHYSPSLHVPPHFVSRQESSAYSGAALHERPHFASGGHESSTIFGHYPNYDGYGRYQSPDFKMRNIVPAGGIQPYHSYRNNASFVDVGPYDKPMYQSRTLTPGSHVGFDPCNRPISEGEFPVSSNYGGPRTPPPYRSIANSGDPRSAHQHVPQQLAFEPHSPRSSYYSQPYGTPPPRLPYASQPYAGHHSGLLMPVNLTALRRPGFLPVDIGQAGAKISEDQPKHY
ncbi:hypothetical protein Syun_010471 [Stephania yunnanensis]|uniref:SPRY domain-containing protein n=1 Tax=Stephania yunnanensis TaxID=152371 RepID=A0AAP0KIV8_9MAGN